MLLKVIAEAADADEEVARIEADLREISDEHLLIERPIGKRTSGAKGDPVTIGMVIITMVGAGGFLSAAAAKGGLLTKLAEILHIYVNRGVEIEISTKGGDKVLLKGNVEDLKLALYEYLQK